VYDVKGQFESLCNKEMVDLDPLESEDAEVLLKMVSNHYEYTKSTVAKFILDDFDNQIKNFIKVYPRDYKKAIKARATEKVTVRR
jgi:glutamate synthase (NADPH/NADH) large chain